MYLISTEILKLIADNTIGDIKSTLSTTLRNPSDCSVLTHSDNTVYAVRSTHSNCPSGDFAYTNTVMRSWSL